MIGGPNVNVVMVVCSCTHRNVLSISIVVSFFFVFYLFTTRSYLLIAMDKAKVIHSLCSGQLNVLFFFIAFCVIAVRADWVERAEWAVRTCVFHY